MAEQRKQRPVLPPPPQQMADEDRAAQERSSQAAADEQAKAEAARAAEAKRAEREAKAAERKRVREDKQRAKEAEAAEAARAEQRETAERERAARLEQAARAEQTPQGNQGDQTARQPAVTASPDDRGKGRPTAPRRTRKAQLRVVQVDAWSVMKTAFLLSIAIGIVLVTAVAIVWSVLGAAGVFDSINSIVQQAVGSAAGPQFDITDYASTSRVLGITMVVSALNVVLITAIATLGAFIYNLAAALLGGIEVTLAEDS